ncbi:MAG TPA: hypothetical protein VGH81_05550 [Rudaea sp.]|jgi:hypothetical protein
MAAILARAALSDSPFSAVNPELQQLEDSSVQGLIFERGFHGSKRIAPKK